MTNIFSKSISFVKDNLSIVYSLFLIVLIPAAFFINNYLTNSSYEENIDKITQRKAVLVENVINNFVKYQMDATTTIQEAIDRIIEQNMGEIVSLSILRPQTEQGEFQIVASSNHDLIGQKASQDLQVISAWVNTDGIASVQRNEQGRFWKVIKSLTDDSGKKIGLVEMSFSLVDSDNLINKTISDSYVILIITILVVVLLVANQARLIGYAFTITQLKEVDKMKDMFISMASHELRSPLTAIKGYLDLIQSQRGITLDENSSRYLDNISLSTKRLDNLVEDILEVSRIEGNRMPVDITSFDPNPIISQSIEELRSQAIQKNLILEYLPVKDQVKVEADQNRLKQVVINLVGNAIKYTKQGSVKVNTAVKNGEFLIVVADTGIGISSENRANLFQKFYRIKNNQTKDIIGTGLGLWITSEIVKRMKGRITVESIEGVGSHFTAYFPIAKK